MRIISGIFKGRRINVPHTITARPTTDFAKEGLFNLLNNKIDFEGIDVLDLFAGTGIIGVEFSSRGANTVTSIEINDRQYSFIRKMVSDLKIENISIFKSDVFKYLKSSSAKFDVIFADPPYDLKELPEIPSQIFSNRLLKPDGLFVLEHSAKQNFTSHPMFIEHRNYGNVNFSFFKAE